MSQNQDLLDDFSAYCKANPSMRFWQALRNWCGHNFVLVSPTTDQPYLNQSYRDTFYWRTRDGVVRNDDV